MPTVTQAVRETPPACGPPDPVADCIHLVEQPSAADFLVIFRGLDDTTAPILGPAVLRPLVLLVRAPDGSTIGGLWGRTVYSWLTIEMLFVPAPLRGRGIGSRLVCRAEAAARQGGCIAAQVCTFDFQAPAFYQRLGYRQFAVQPDMPPGHSTCFFVKPLAA